LGFGLEGLRRECRKGAGQRENFDEINKNRSNAVEMEMQLVCVKT